MVQLSSILSVSALVALSTDAAIHRDLRSTFEKQETANVFVVMKEGTSTARHNVEYPRSASRGEKIGLLREALIKQSEESQSSILSQLARTRSIGKFQSFWITNEVYIEGASLDLVEELHQIPNVADIYEEKIIQLEPLMGSLEEDLDSKNRPEWGLEFVNAPNVWSNGNKGAGVVIGSIDTGAQVTHESLIGSYVAANGDKYGWYDPQVTSNKSPVDDNGHGTHTIGTMVGSGGIGVAPDAKWMSCRGCGPRGCTLSALIGCGEFMVCPHDHVGRNPDCSQAPAIVSNSWGGGQADTFYDKVIAAWHDADIVPVFAMGNSGSRCGTANSPGDNKDVIGVGATTKSMKLASFSSRGPPRADSKLMKPDVSAPGQNVRSAWIGSDRSYRTISGTSMACPHVSGVIALMLAENPAASYGDIYETLTNTCDQKRLKPERQTCGSIHSSNFPNFLYGYGLVDALKSCSEV